MSRNLPCSSNGIERQKRANNLIKELFRKSIHLCSACIPFLLTKAYVLILSLLSFVLVAYSIAELLRKKGHPVPVISAITAVASRKRDEDKFVLGPVTLALGIIITALCFNQKSYTLGIYALAFGDGLASLVGKLLGTIAIPFVQNKTVAGSLACFVSIFCSSYLVLNNALFAFILAGLGMFLEMLPLKDFDNLAIPILIAAFAQYVLHIV